MILYRLEIDGRGLWRATRQVRDACPRSVYHSFLDVRSEMGDRLHSPDSDDFYNFAGKEMPPSNALFYLTEKGCNMFAEHITRLKEIFSLTEVKFNVIEKDLSKLSSYKCWYQDDLQMCIEPIKIN